MKRFAAILFSALALPLLGQQELFPVGVNLYTTRPADTAGKIYGTGWKIGLPFYFHEGRPVEGRLRIEIGEFQEGSSVGETPFQAYRYKARTRLVGYDWLVALGERQSSQVDLILGIGGAHWYRDRRTINKPAGTSSTETDIELAFAATLGFRLRLQRNIALELHHVFTSLPGKDKDFEDQELSHTALGVAFRF